MKIKNAPPPWKKQLQKGGGDFLCLSLIVPGFFGGVRLAYQNSTEKMMAMFFLVFMNVSDGVHKLQSSKVFLIYYKPYVSDILLINVNLYDISREGHCYSCFIGIWRTWNHLA